MISRLSIDNPGVWLDSGTEGRFTGTFCQRWSEGLFSPVVAYASRFRNCAFAELNCIGGARKKWESQKPRVNLRREFHAVHAVLKARDGASGFATNPSAWEVTIKAAHSSPLVRASGRAKPGFP
jgi:hypothetical protein